MTTAISVQNISKSYDKKTVLANISFSIQKGQIIALLGENGAGKSTLINIILGLIKKDTGKVSVLQKSITKNRQLIGVMMQNDIVLSRIKVKEIIHLYQSYYKTPFDFNQLLQIANLQDQSNSLVTSLSGGQKRRLSFALALAGDPSIIFLDEPTNGMDPLSRINFWKEISKLKSQGKTILITSHHLNELENIVDSYLVLKNHQLIFSGDLEKLRSLTAPTEISFDSDLSQQIFTSIPETISITNYSNHYIISTKNVNTILNSLNPLLNDIQNLNIKQTDLESIFLDLNKRGGTHD